MDRFDILLAWPSMRAAFGISAGRAPHTMQAKHKSLRPSSPTGIVVREEGDRVSGRRSDAVKKTWAQIRRTMLLADQFRVLCELKTEPPRLASALADVISSGRGGFRIAAKLRPSAAAENVVALEEEESRCLADLEALLEGLRVGSPPPARELQHAFDSLLVQCVLLDALVSEQADDASVDPLR